MIKVPVRIDNVCDWVGPKIDESLCELGTRYTNSGIDEYLTVRACEHSNVSA
jgi:hypothetical protein